MPPYQYRSSSRKMAGVDPRSARVRAFARERGIGRTRTRKTTSSTPQISKRAGHDTIINVPPSMQCDGERKTFHFGKRIPLTIPKLRRSALSVNRYSAQAETARDEW